MGLLTDKIALVTGASRGIGAETARLLAERGAWVAVSGRTLPDLENVATEIRNNGGISLPVQCDVTEAGQVQSMVQRVVAEWGRLDILVNNAGMGSPAVPVEEIPPDAWDKTIVLNLKSSFLCVRFCGARHEAPELRSHREHVIFLGEEITPASAALPMRRQKRVCSDSHGRWHRSWVLTGYASMPLHPISS